MYGLTIGTKISDPEWCDDRQPTLPPLVLCILTSYNN